MAVFFTDRDLGKRFPELLTAAGIRVERHDAHFAHDTTDEVWIEAVASRGWVAVTHDRRIRYKPNEQEAVRQFGLALLVLVGKTSTAELAQNFITTLPRIERFLTRHRAPFIAKVFRPTMEERRRKAGAPGRVEMWLKTTRPLAR